MFLKRYTILRRETGGVLRETGWHYWTYTAALEACTFINSATVGGGVAGALGAAFDGQPFIVWKRSIPYGNLRIIKWKKSTEFGPPNES